MRLNSFSVVQVPYFLLSCWFQWTLDRIPSGFSARKGCNLLPTKFRPQGILSLPSRFRGFMICIITLYLRDFALKDCHLLARGFRPQGILLLQSRFRLQGFVLLPSRFRPQGFLLIYRFSLT